MKYKMVVCDFDDTLIDSEGTGEGISKYTVETIAEYMDKGGIFTVSTGRNMGSLLRQVSALGIEGRDVPLMSLNGAYVINNRTGKTIRDLYIDYETAVRVCLECEKRGLNYHFYDKDYAYLSDISGHSEDYLKYTKSPAKAVGKISDYIIKNKPECMKMLIMEMPEVLAAVREEFPNLFPGLSFLSSNKYLVEIISKDSGKGNALKFAAQLYNIPISEVMAIGDSMNDYSMIQVAGLGVAMGNACDELKKIAGFVTKSCLEDGAAHAIRKFCLD